MEKGRTAQSGSLRISEDVILTITKQVVLDVEGVHSLASGRFSLKDFVVRSETANPIRIVLNVDVAQINICVNLVYGYKIKDVAEQIQSNVKATVQNMTGITVSKVNVYIAGVVKEETI
ncbi:MAG: Asp23/Gls24 family envelope stress response protein [Oscillospiraceae bacterium]|jgi:uncharacterized alkaline shock family protein YloU